LGRTLKEIIAEQSETQGKSWQDLVCRETYVRVKGKWCYLYRGIDEDGNLVMG